MIKTITNAISAQQTTVAAAHGTELVVRFSVTAVTNRIELEISSALLW